MASFSDQILKPVRTLRWYTLECFRLEAHFSSCDCTFATLDFGNSYSFKGTLASFKYLKKPSSEGSRNNSAFPEPCTASHTLVKNCVS
jgi:hypothetical protein